MISGTRRFIASGVFFLLSVTGASAVSQELTEYSAAELWYHSLPETERTEIQTDLIWTGDYSQLVDGLFGNNTLNSIKSFETRIGSEVNGVLDAAERSRIRADANFERSKVGFRQVYQSAAQFWIGLPTDVIKQTKVDEFGSEWKSHDDRLFIVIARSRYEKGSFAETYKTLVTDNKFGEVKFRTFRPGYFIFSTVAQDTKFYFRGQDDNGSIIGFIAIWKKSGNDADIRKLVVAISNSMDTDGSKASASPPTNERIVQQNSDKIEQAPIPEPLEKAVQTGTGFFVSSAGHLITNAHVIEDCGDATLRLSDGRESHANILSRNARDDLAILKSQINAPAYATFRESPPLRLGTDIVVFGYPRLDLLTTTGNLVNGLVSGLAGPNNDASLIQISAPVQSGNSGGAVLDKSGNVIGVIVAKTNITANDDKIEVLQQANFAINADLVRSYLTEQGISINSSASNQDKQTADIADVAKGFTAIVLCQPQ